MSQWKYTPELKTQTKLVWLGALQTFLGWTPGQVEAWSSKYEDDLNSTDPISPFFHETALRYVAPIVMINAFGKSVVSSLDVSDYYKIMTDMMMAITERGKLFPEKEDFDWVAAKFRVDRSFTEHRQRLGLAVESNQAKGGGEGRCS